MFINVNELVIKYYTSLRNVVSTLNLGCVLNLKNIALEARNTEYKPTRFAALIMSIHNPFTTAPFFKTGKTYTKIRLQSIFILCFKI